MVLVACIDLQMLEARRVQVQLYYMEGVQVTKDRYRDHNEQEGTSVSFIVSMPPCGVLGWRRPRTKAAKKLDDQGSVALMWATVWTSWFRKYVLADWETGSGRLYSTHRLP